jgi:hypothetical protein
MFRTACDNCVTTSQARRPTNSKPAHLEMPAGKPDVRHTSPRQPRHCPATARQALIATHHDSPSIRHANPCGTGRVIPLRTLVTLGLPPAPSVCVRRITHTGTLTKHPHAS